ncbi:hypothetical protein AAIH33_35240, partial [Pseudomonas aeruginosa]|uniref:hypothetical protein n=1 Tax=Pseudomonas aeruginosa TaxID=287 RepID=UPI0031B6B36D
TTNWAANLGMRVVEEVKRLNGKTVSEGLLREVVRHLGNWLELHECECDGGFHYCGRAPAYYAFGEYGYHCFFSADSCMLVSSWLSCTASLKA